MDLSLILGLIGTIATIVFGFLSIDLFKRKNYPGKLTYIELSLIDLLNNVANNFKEIELLHNKLPINKNLVYLKGALINNGDIDINSKLTEKDITIELPEKCKWLDIKATEFSEGLNVDVTIHNESKASFKFDLFRKDEFVQFEGLIESETKEISSEVINSDMLFTHRIENTSKIEKKVLLSENEIKKKKKMAIMFSIGLFAMLLTITATSVFNVFGSKKESVFFRKIGEIENVFYSIKKNDGLFYLSAYNGGKDATVKIEEFTKNYKASNDSLTFWQKFKDSYWMITIQLGFFLIIVLWELLEIRTAKKLSRVFIK
jgi:hypothetical protein